MGYTSFLSSPKATALPTPPTTTNRPLASTSNSTSPPQRPAAATAPATTNKRSNPSPAAATPSASRSNGKRPRIIDFQSDDDGDDRPSDADEPSNGHKNARHVPPPTSAFHDARDSLTTGGKGKGKGKGKAAFEGLDTGVRERLRVERERLEATRKELPIWAGQDAIVQAVKDNDTVVVLGETGSGKTTQVPQFLLPLLPSSSSSTSQKVLITQPRRIAALALSSRVAAERGTPVGGEVGHSVRFDTVVGKGTRVVFATEGMVVRELLGDKLLSRYSIIVIDEAHERSIATDVLLGSVKRIQALRKDRATADGLGQLKVVVMSATLDAERFSDFFHQCPILYVRGRQHPVKVYHALSDPDDHVDACVRTVLQLLVRPPPPALPHASGSVEDNKGGSDILVFLTGQEDIDSATQTLTHLVSLLPPTASQVLVLPFMASTPPALQAKVFAPAPHGARKVILSTNVAETSITVPGVGVVVDCGLAKEKGYVSRRGSGIETLLVKRISQSAAQQRTGRAGREGPGTCYRLYTSQTFEAMAPSPLPEIQRSDLTQTVLQLKEMGVDDVQTFDFLDRPDPDFIAESLMALHGLGAIDNTLSVTPLGRQMLKFPLEPSQARVLTASIARGCTSDVLDILALVNDSPIFLDPLDKRDEAALARASFAHRDGDHLTLLNVLKSYEAIPKRDTGGRKAWCRARFVNERNLKRAIQARDQMRGICEREGVSWSESKGDDKEPVLRCLVEGMFTKCAVWSGGEYRQVVGNSAVKIHPSSTLHNKRAPAILYDEIIHTTNTYARGVSQVHHSWLAELPMFNARAG